MMAPAPVPQAGGAPLRAAPPPHIAPLTSLRFFAALGVLLCHFYPLVPPLPKLKFLSDLGSCGVTLFFILSGFVLTWRYDSPARPGQSASAALDLRAFWVARVARILPLYWLALALNAVVYLASGFAFAIEAAPDGTAALWAGFVLNWLALQPWVPDTAVQQYWNAPSWSVSSELFFYACFPLLLRVRWLSGSLCSFVGVLALFGALLAAYLGTLALTGNLNLRWVAYAHRLPLFGLYPFVLGILLCRHLRAAPQPWPRPGRVVLLALALLVLAGWLTAVQPGGEITTPRLLEWLLTPMFVYSALLTLVIGGIAQCTGRLRGWLSRPGLVLLGDASYAMYLLHYLPLSIALVYCGRHGLPPYGLAALLLGVALMGYAILSYKLFEAPARRRVIAAFSRRPAVA